MSDESTNLSEHDETNLELFVQRILDNCLDQRGRSELAQWVQQDSHCCEQLALHFYIDSLLKEELAESAGIDLFREILAQKDGKSDQSPIGRETATITGLAFGPHESTQHPLPVLFDDSLLSGRWPWLAGISIVALVLAVFGGYVAGRSVGTDRVAVTNRGSSTVVEPAAAYLTMSNGVVWGGDRPEARNVGSAVQTGDEIAINEGIAEFRLASGVYLSVEGPTSMMLISSSVIVLQYGKLTAHVPWTVTDFKAIASSCRITACDAEFGLMHDGSKLEIHTFSGEVRAESPQVVRETDSEDLSDGGSVTVDDAGLFTKGTITAGNSLVLAAQGEVLKLLNLGSKAAPWKFATKLPMAGALPVTPAYVERVLESNPLGYWRFESTKGKKVSNEIPGGSDLRIVGNVRSTGRVENPAVEFQPKSGAYLISEPLNELANSDYSVEAWVKPSHFHRGNVLSLLGTEPDHATSLELQGAGSSATHKNNPNTVRFVHFNPHAGGWSSKTSCFSKTPYAVRRWQHFVAVKEGVQMRLYVNGVLSSTAREETSLATGLRLALGWISITPDRGFVGQLDEVAVYTHALTDKEVRAHYKAVKDVIDSRPPPKPIEDGTAVLRLPLDKKHDDESKPIAATS